MQLLYSLLALHNAQSVSCHVVVMWWSCGGHVVVMWWSCVVLSRPYLWGEAGRKAETERREVGWLQWQTPGARQVLDSLDSHRMRLSLDHFPQHTPLEVRMKSCRYVTITCSYSLTWQTSDSTSIYTCT